MDAFKHDRLPFLLQPASYPVWIQAIGRFLYQGGYGTIQFYIPLIFVNQIGLSATVVGIGVGSGSIAGVFGHLLGGYLADSPLYGRKRALLFSALLAILAAIALAFTHTLPMLIVTNLMMGLSAGCYWTAADATVIDVTPSDKRHTAFSVLSLSDSLGWGLGIWAGGILLSLVASTQTLFWAGSLVLFGFLILIQTAVAETPQEQNNPPNTLAGFTVALRDRALLLFVLVNVLFTTAIALVSSTLPLYFTQVATASEAISVASVANLFSWCYIGMGAVIQVPIVQWLSAMSRVRVLMLSMILWGIGFILVWATDVATAMQLIWMIIALSILSIATVIYKPFAPAIVAELAPSDLRGIYLALSYQCWSIGYFIGPILGGWALDQTRSITHTFWLATASCSIIGLVILAILAQSKYTNTALPQSEQVIERSSP